MHLRWRLQINEHFFLSQVLELVTLKRFQNEGEGKNTPWNISCTCSTFQKPWITWEQWERRVTYIRGDRSQVDGPHQNELVGMYLISTAISKGTTVCIKGNTKFWYGVMNLVQMNTLEAHAILQYSVIVVAVEIESKVMKLLIIHSLCCIPPSQGHDIN